MFTDVENSVKDNFLRPNSVRVKFVNFNPNTEKFLALILLLKVKYGEKF